MIIIYSKSKGMPRLICAPIKLIRKEIQVAIIEVLAQGSLGFSPLIREVGEERGGRGGSLPSSPSDRERRVGSSHGLNWAPILATHTHRWEVLSSSHITDLVTFLLLLRSGLQSS